MNYNSLLYLKEQTTYKSFLKFTNNLKTIKVQFFPREYCIRAMLYEPFIMQQNFVIFHKKKDVEKMLNVIQSSKALQGNLIKDKAKIWKSTLEIQGVKKRKKVRSLILKGRRQAEYSTQQVLEFNDLNTYKKGLQEKLHSFVLR